MPRLLLCLFNIDNVANFGDSTNPARLSAIVFLKIMDILRKHIGHQDREIPVGLIPLKARVIHFSALVQLALNASAIETFKQGASGRAAINFIQLKQRLNSLKGVTGLISLSNVLSLNLPHLIILFNQDLNFQDVLIEGDVLTIKPKAVKPPSGCSIEQHHISKNDEHPERHISFINNRRQPVENLNRETHLHLAWFGSSHVTREKPVLQLH